MAKGFASMDPEKRRVIASLGGIAAHKSGRAHGFTSETARIAGSKGGSAPHVNRPPKPKKVPKPLKRNGVLIKCGLCGKLGHRKDLCPDLPNSNLYKMV